MSLLKLLFDLPEAGGESNFTVEEQEELMAFEHNLDEHLQENFDLPVSEDFAFFQGATAFKDDDDGGGQQTLEECGGVGLLLPDANGGNHHNGEEGTVVSVGNGIESGKIMSDNSVVVVETTTPESNGIGFENSTFIGHHLPSTMLEDYAPTNKEHGTEFENSTTRGLIPSVLDDVAPINAHGVGFENSTITNPIPSSLEDVAPINVRGVGFENLTTSGPIPSSLESNVPGKEHVANTEHSGSGQALWLKWRGKWQAGIKVLVQDCKAATVKAMPTYGKKEYIPVYLVGTRVYIWVDAQNICSITEAPEPLLSGTHDEWRKLVIDTEAPRRRMFLTLGWEMLDISDRLHILGVVERARMVSLWKEFAKEAIEASKYSELGSLLVRIQAVVEPVYVRQSWIEKRMNLWVEECMKAETAANIEKLTKEAIRIILWDEAAKLWEAPLQPVLDPGWTNWKGAAFDEVTSFEDDSPVPSDNPARASTSSLPIKSDKEGSSAQKRGRKADAFKKPKEEHSPAAANFVSLCSQTLVFPVDATKKEIAVDYALETTLLASGMDKDQGCGSKLSQDAPLNSASKTWKWKFKSDAWGCSAYLKSRKRRCPRQAWRGIYCEKHQGVAEIPPVCDPDVEPSHLCMARYWVENRRCANSVREGTYYCDMHAEKAADYRVPKPEDSEVFSEKQFGLEGDNEKVVTAKHLRCNGVTAQATQRAHKLTDGPGNSVKNSSQAGGGSSTSSVIDGASVVKTEQQDQHRTAVGVRCIGRIRRADGQCTHRAKAGSEYCEKHLKTSTAGFSGSIGTSGPAEGPLDDKNLSKLVADLSLKDRKSFARARDLLCKYMNAGLSSTKGTTESANCTKMLDFVVEEAVKDSPSGEMLLKILVAEREKLRKIVLEEGSVYTKGSNLNWNSVSSSAMPALHTTTPPKLKMEPSASNCASQAAVSSSQVEIAEGSMDFGLICCLCNQKFEQQSILGKHWKEQHKREAHLFEKCILCRICGNNGEIFKTKLGVVRHWRAAHPTIAMSCPGWSVCLMCDKECRDFDHLWQHVEDQHHGQWSSPDFATRVNVALLSHEGQRCCFCHEVFSSLWELQNHKNAFHKEQQLQLQHSGMKRNGGTMEPDGTDEGIKMVDTNGVDVALKYTCRYCGMKFRLLPDLGRHHQSDHRSQIVQEARGKYPTTGKMRGRKKKVKQEGYGVEWSAPAVGKGEVIDKEGKGKKWRYRARSKAKSGTRGRIVPMKRQSGGAEAILQRMRAVKQVLEEHKTRKRPPRKRDRKAERARRLARLAGAGELPSSNKHKCRFCGLQFPSLPDLGRHHQAEHSALKQAFITNSLGECQTGIFTLSKDGILIPLQSEKLKRSPNSKELLEVARSACCKDWLFNELGKRFIDLQPRVFVQAAHLCSEAKVEIRWHQEKYVCPDGCKAFGEPDDAVPSMEVDLDGFTGIFPKPYADDIKESVVCALNLTSSSKSSLLRRLVLSEDLSKGLERVPITCVIDGDALEPCNCQLCIGAGSLAVQGDSQSWDSFVYITQRLLDPSLGLDTKSSQVGCSCNGEQCSASTCDHVSMFDNDNSEACTVNGDSIRGQFPYDSNGHIILDVGYMVYECNSSCHCKDGCQNRVVQKGVRVKLEVFKSRHKGWAVRAAEFIPRGTFVCEYVGEVLNDSEANRRGERYDQVGCSFLYNIDAHLDVTNGRRSSKPFVIDATRYGNVARFINHSCEPNLINYEVLVESMDCQLAHIGFFAKRDIAMGEELSYNYRYKLLPGKGFPCHCRAPTCRGRLY